MLGCVLLPARAKADPPESAGLLLLQDFGRRGERARLVAAFAAHERRRLALQAASSTLPARSESDARADRTLIEAHTLLATDR